MYVCMWVRQASPRGQDSKAKLPIQRGAVEASNKLLHVIWMRPELPAERVRGQRVCLSLNCLSLSVRL